VTTQDAPLVFPSIAFRPLRLAAISVAVGALATVGAAMVGHLMIGVFFSVGLLLGLVNAILVRRSVDAITAEEHPLKKKMALNSATRLLIMTVIGLAIAITFRPAGIGVLFGMAIFQVLLVLMTALPVYKAVRAGGGAGAEGSATVSAGAEGSATVSAGAEGSATVSAAAEGTEGTVGSDD
jgi:hypothetical protein